MARERVAKGLTLSLCHAPCAHICRYCLISETRKGSPLPFSRFEALVHRFLDWKTADQRDDIEIRTFVGPSFDYEIETLKGVARIRARRGDEFRILNLGGLRIRDENALSAWLDERQAAGIVGFHTSLAGCDHIHDRWNGRAGDFAYQTAILRLAGERGMVRRERLFIAQNTLPLFDRLLDILDAVPGEVQHRYLTLFFYAGLARRYENERITEEIRDTLPERINKLRRGRFDEWWSEREWIPVMMETAGEPRKLIMKLDVNEANIDELEQSSCDAVFAEREQVYRKDYRRMPGLDELCERYGDRTNGQIYMLRRDLEQKWTDMHARATGTTIPLD